MSLQESDNKWFSNGKYKITRGYYCIYDSFSNVDIHIEMNIPGQMKMFGFTSESNILTINDKLWEKGIIKI